MADLTPTEIRQALANPANQPRLPAQHLERFDASQLASVLEQEIGRAMASGLSHIGLNLNLTDCRALANALRTAAIAGH